jgi:tetratricopeptide (TPR) repeat protein
MHDGGPTYGVIGALAAFPRRLAAREVERQGGRLRRGVTRHTTHVVFARSLLERAGEGEIASHYDRAAAAGQQVLSEAGFLQRLGIVSAQPALGIDTATLLEQSRLDPRELALLALFDAFEHGAEPWSFRDVILARKYAGLIAGGAGWQAIARSVQRTGEVTSLTAVSLHVDARRAIYARRGEGLSELDGQALLPLDMTDPDLDRLFMAAEAAEAAGEHERAVELYQRYLSADPDDSVAAFNLGNVLRAAGRPAEAAHAYAQAIRHDPGFVEAWFNCADLLRSTGHFEAAREHLMHAIASDPDYSDAVYNLAALEYDCGRLAEARRWWVRYLELDPGSNWARTAARGIQFADLELSGRNGTQ